MGSTSPTSSGPSVVATLRRFLNCYWLRPENAFWMALRSQALGAAELAVPGADLGCGDGIFTFLHAGGDFDLGFDVFSSVGRLDRVRDDHADMFDHVEPTYAPCITRRPDTRLAMGADHKQSMLDKAGALGIYERLVVHDHNLPLPFEDSSFGSVHCNCAYWVREIDSFLRHVGRILRPDGRALFSVKLAAMKDYTLQRFGDRLGQRWLALIDRGRMVSWPSLADRDTWCRRFEGAGFAIESAVPFITRTHAHVWDVGLRPIAPLLIKMANGLTAENRRQVKSEWIGLFCELLEPLCDPTFDLFAEPAEPAEILFVLRPR